MGNLNHKFKLEMTYAYMQPEDETVCFVMYSLISPWYKVRLPIKLLNRPFYYGWQGIFEFTIGIDSRNPGFWAATNDGSLYLYKSYSDYKKDISSNLVRDKKSFERLCHDGIYDILGRDFPMKQFCQPTKVGVKVTTPYQFPQ